MYSSTSSRSVGSKAFNCFKKHWLNVKDDNNHSFDYDNDFDDDGNAFDDYGHSFDDDHGFGDSCAFADDHGS